MAKLNLKYMQCESYEQAKNRAELFNGVIVKHDDLNEVFMNHCERPEPDYTKTGVSHYAAYTVFYWVIAEQLEKEKPQ